MVELPKSGRATGYTAVLRGTRFSNDLAASREDPRTWMRRIAVTYSRSRKDQITDSAQSGYPQLSYQCSSSPADAAGLLQRRPSLRSGVQTVVKVSRGSD